MMEDAKTAGKRYAEIEKIMKEESTPSLSKTMIKFFDRREAEEEGLTDADIYNSVNVNRDLFCKIKNNSDYKTSKETILIFAVALHLNLDETQELLASAGYTLTDSLKFDQIIKYFIKNGDYDCYKIDSTLEHFGQTRLFKVREHKSKYDRK